MIHSKNLSVVLFVLLGLLTKNLIAQSDSSSLIKDSLAEDMGIQFVKSMSWKEVLEKSKTENKYIFLDGYATWCGPCKWMARNIFTQPMVANFYNGHFICVSVQFDKTEKDSEDIRNWYVDADSLRRQYNVYEYPTFLFFSPDGVMVHRVAGATTNGEEFIAKGKEALNPFTQNFTGIREWHEHLSDTALLWKAYTTNIRFGDKATARTIGRAYLNLQTNLFLPRNLRLIEACGLLDSSESSSFQFFLANAARIDDSIGGPDKRRNFAESALAPALFKKELAASRSANGAVHWRMIESSLDQNYPTLANSAKDILHYDFEQAVNRTILNSIQEFGNTVPDFKKITASIGKEFPDFDFELILLKRESDYFQHHELWQDCSIAAFQLMRRYGKIVDQSAADEINNIAWDWVFMHCEDRKVLREAVKKMKEAINIVPNELYCLDTYANLLYKIGDKKKALELENTVLKKAKLERVAAADLQQWETNLHKMKERQPTWPVGSAS